MKINRITFNNLDIPVEAMGNCYNRKCTEKGLERAVRSGHLSLLEHTWASAHIEVSQKLLAQITRHRHFSFTVESTIGSDMSNVATYDGFDRWLNNKIAEQTAAYVEAMNRGYSKEQCGYLLPLGANVKLTMTGDLRTWFEFLQKRLCRRNSKECLELALALYKEFNQAYPNIFNADMMRMCEGCRETSCSWTEKGYHDPIRKVL